MAAPRLSLAASLLLTLLSPARATAEPVRYAQAEDTCRQTTSQLDVYAQPDRSAEVVGRIRRGDRVIVSGPSGTAWTPIEIPKRGYILSRYLEACSGSSSRLEDPNSTTALGPAQAEIVAGCGQVVDLGSDAAAGTLRRLPLYPALGNTAAAPFDAIAPRSLLVLGPSIQRGGRYWVSVLAYQPADPASGSTSQTGTAWATESGPNVPDDLRRDATDNLVYPNGRPYLDLTIVRRPCLNVFGPAITEDQPLPDSLPQGYQTP